MCVCVFFSFILDINGRTSRGHTGGRSHRISHPPSFCGACTCNYCCNVNGMKKKPGKNGTFLPGAVKAIKITRKIDKVL